MNTFDASEKSQHIKEMKSLALEACALLVEERAKLNCPVDTGQLRLSMGVEQKDEDTYIIYNNAEYAPYVEFGTGLFAVNGDGRQTPWCYQDLDGNWHTTVGQHPQPFLHRALDESRSEIVKIFESNLSKAMRGK